MNQRSNQAGKDNLNRDRADRAEGSLLAEQFASVTAKRAHQADEPDPWSEVVVNPQPRTEPPATVVIHHPEESDPWALVAEPAHPVVPAPIQSETDALIDAIFAGSRTVVTPVKPIDQKQAQYAQTLIERVTRPSMWWPPSMMRWVVPALIAFVIGVLFTVFELRTLQPRRATLVTEKASTTPIAALPLPSRPIAPTPSATTLTLPGVEGSRVAALLPAPTPSAIAGSTKRPAVSPVATPAPTVAGRAGAPSLPNQPNTTVPSAPTAPSAPVPSVPIANTPLSSAAVAPAPTPVPRLPDRTPAPTPATETAGGVPTRPPTTVPDEEAVRRALGQYVAAFGELNVTATELIWPSVDRRALTRAFGSLKSQEIAFDNCDVKAAGSNATARCRGTVQYVRKVGSPGPHTEPEQWLFKMQKYGTEWKIDQVTASQESTSHTASPSR